MPRICSKIKGQNLNYVIKNNNFNRDLQLANTSFNGEVNVDVLIGAEYIGSSLQGDKAK